MPYDKNWVKKLKLNIKKELRKKGKHSPAGIKYMKTLQKPPKEKKIAYYGQGRETADIILRRLKKKK